jgi:hypothetical protein
MNNGHLFGLFAGLHDNSDIKDLEKKKHREIKEHEVLLNKIFFSCPWSVILSNTGGISYMFQIPLIFWSSLELLRTPHVLMCHT